MYELDASYAALADPTRRAILARLARGPAAVGDLAAPFPISGPAISRHLKVLENAQLILRERRGQTHILRLHPPGLKAAHDWLNDYQGFWMGALERLDSHLSSSSDIKEK